MEYKTKKKIKKKIVCAICNKERNHASRGVCESCWDKEYRKKGKCKKCNKKNRVLKGGLCIKCHNQKRRKRKRYEWSYDYAECIICKTTNNKHHGKGFCEVCRRKYDLTYIANQNKWDEIKYKRILKDKGLYEKKKIKDKAWRENNPQKIALYKAIANVKSGVTANINKDINLIKKEIARIKNEDKRRSKKI